MQIEEYINIPYNTIPRMKPYEGSLIISNPSTSHLTEKKHQLDLHGERIWFQSDLAYHHKLVGKTSLALGLERETEITKLGLKIQEDIVIVYRGRLEAAFVAFPSGWLPGDKQGKTLQELHEPVADGYDLRRMSNKITELMCGPICWHRGVWTLTTANSLSALPYSYVSNANTVNDLWFRYEHQITFPIEEKISSGFLIDVQLIAFTTLPKNIQKQISESINSMSAAILSYKNLHNIKKILNEYGI